LTRQKSDDICADLEASSEADEEEKSEDRVESVTDNNGDE
jgi:hypothetical protein